MVRVCLCSCLGRVSASCVFSHSVSLFCLSGMKKSSACVSKALIVLSASSLQKKNFQKKFLTVDHLAHMSMKDAAKCEN